MTSPPWMTACSWSLYGSLLIYILDICLCDSTTIVGSWLLIPNVKHTGLMSVFVPTYRPKSVVRNRSVVERYCSIFMLN